MTTLGRDICGTWDTAVGREWLVTNGLGGYACGTIAGANTRRYHAFLMASLAPPATRTLLVAKVDISVRYGGATYHLSANEFEGGVIDPHGFIHLESFTVVDGLPIWRYAVADALIEQRIFMAQGANTSYLRLDVLRADAPVEVSCKPLLTHRDYHAQTRGSLDFRAVGDARACAVALGDAAPFCHLGLAGGTFVPAPHAYWNFLHREEFGRGLDAVEDLWGPGLFKAELRPGEPRCFVASVESTAPDPDAVLEAQGRRAAQRRAALPASAPPWVQDLAVASDAFIVERRTAGPRSAAPANKSIIAGFPWFTDWGRDTMIALPGLTTVLGRFDEAAEILRTYASFVRDGLLPNRFADAGEGIEYNTADATLWLFQALNEQLEARRDTALLKDLYPVLSAVIRAHGEGTRFGIGVDPVDGLLRAGAPHVQLTWMDAKQGDHVFTPRAGKPVEINALWLNALEVFVRLAGQVRNAADKRYAQGLLERARSGFARFWNEEQGCLFDVLDRAEDGAADASVRPNQLLAVALPLCVLPAAQQRAVVDTCARRLLTSHGLRSLSPEDPAYIGHYAGNQWERDAAYHQGTVWSWLLGPFVRAHFRVYGNAAAAQAYLAPIAQHLDAACVGSVSEVFDGDAPHAARGCFAQAWSVAEILRSWVLLERQADGRRLPADAAPQAPASSGKRRRSTAEPKAARAPERPGARN